MTDPLEYEKVEPRGRQVAAFIGQLLLWYAQYAAVMFVLAFVVPRFRGIFTDYRVSLSAPTVLLLLAGRLCHDYALWLWLSPLPAVLALIIAPPRANRGASGHRRWSRLLATLVMATFLLFVIYALGMPLTALINGLSSAK